MATLEDPTGAQPVVAFIGFMGAGKTRAGRGAAAALGERFVDTDEEVERTLGASTAEIFERDGEARFREAEEDAALAALNGGGFVSLGGGAIESSAVRAALSECFTVWCEVSEEVAWQRCEDSDRPLASNRDGFAQLLANRTPVYEELADAVLGDGGERTGRLAAGWLRAAAGLAGRAPRLGIIGLGGIPGDRGPRCAGPA